jgi:hypothetical protein
VRNFYLGMKFWNAVCKFVHGYAILKSGMNICTWVCTFEARYLKKLPGYAILKPGLKLIPRYAIL